jgi:hypothetical protein
MRGKSKRKKVWRKILIGEKCNSVRNVSGITNTQKEAQSKVVSRGIQILIIQSIFYSILIDFTIRTQSFVLIVYLTSL